MNDADIFHQALSTMGGRLDMSRLNPRAAALYDQQRSRVQRYIASARALLPKLPPIYFDFIDCPEVNACAFPFAGKYFIGITGGAAVALRFVFARMLADRRVFPQIGHVNQEVENLPLVAGLGPDAQRLRDNATWWSSPCCPARNLYASYLADTAFDFLLCHEMHHITNGHVDYDNAQRGLPFLAELQWHPVDVEVSLDDLTMEMNADWSAVCDGIGSIRMKIEDPSKTAAPYRSYYRDAVQALFDWSFAICTLKRLFGAKPFAGGDQTKEDHPPFRVRQMMALTTAASFIIEKWDASLDESAAVRMLQAMTDVEQAFSIVTGEPCAVQGLTDAWGNLGKDYANRLIEHWKTKLRSKLVPFAYLQLAN
jgi:hypothetical protein